MWYLYIVECSDGTLYTGVTKDIDRRLYEHNNTSRGAKYTKTRRPGKLVMEKPYPDQSSAQSAEHFFKGLPRSEKLKLIRVHNAK